MREISKLEALELLRLRADISDYALLQALKDSFDGGCCEEVRPDNWEPYRIEHDLFPSNTVLVIQKAHMGPTRYFVTERRAKEQTTDPTDSVLWRGRCTPKVSALLGDNPTHRDKRGRITAKRRWDYNE